jgi:hypothetical protein
MGSTRAAFVKILRDASPHFIAAHDEIKPRFPSCRDSRSVPKSIGENKRPHQLGGRFGWRGGQPKTQFARCLGRRARFELCQALSLFRFRDGFVAFERGDLLLDLFGGSVNFLVCGSMPYMIIAIFIDTSSYSARLANPLFFAIAPACASTLGSGLSGSAPS